MILLPHKSITEFLSIFMTTLACVEMMIQVIMKLTISIYCDIITIG